MVCSRDDVLSCQKLVQTDDFHLDLRDCFFPCAPRYPCSEKHHKQKGSNANNLVTVPIIPSQNICTHQKQFDNGRINCQSIDAVREVDINVLIF